MSVLATPRWAGPRYHIPRRCKRPQYVRYAGDALEKPRGPLSPSPARAGDPPIEMAMQQPWQEVQEINLSAPRIEGAGDSDANERKPCLASLTPCPWLARGHRTTLHISMQVCSGYARHAARRRSGLEEWGSRPTSQSYMPGRDFLMTHSATQHAATPRHLNLVGWRLDATWVAELMTLFLSMSIYLDVWVSQFVRTIRVLACKTAPLLPRRGYAWRSVSLPRGIGHNPAVPGRYLPPHMLFCTGPRSASASRSLSCHS